MHEVVFLQPVYVGDLVSFYTTTEKVGRTSIRVRVKVRAHRQRQLNEAVDVTEAVVVYVAIDDAGNPIPVKPE
jgi:acyl-CoA thioesterase YciA